MADERLAVLGEEYSVDILAATAEPMSARELSDALGVPIATCYRRIEALVEAGLLEEEGRELSDRGRRTSVYRRTVCEVVVSFADDRVRVSATGPRSDEPDPKSAQSPDR